MFYQELMSLGVPAHLDGFEYLNYAIEHYKPRINLISVFYPKIAAHFNTSASSIGRAMRTAIDKTEEHITPGEFIAKYYFLWRKTENGNHN